MQNKIVLYNPHSQSYAKQIVLILLLLTSIVGTAQASINAQPVGTGDEQGSASDSGGYVTQQEDKEKHTGTCRKTSQGDHDCTDDEETIKAIYEAGIKAIKTTKTKLIKAQVTGYSSRAQETDSTPEIAANGQNIWQLYQKGLKTCASNDHKLGTVLTIEGLGTCTVRDRMNKRYTGTGRIDWYFGYDTASAYKHGIKTLNVTL